MGTGQTVSRRSQRVASVNAAPTHAGTSSSHPTTCASGRGNGTNGSSVVRGSTTMRRSKSMPAAEKRSDEQGGKSHVATPTLRKSRTSVHSGSSNLPKATSAAAAGAGSVATKVRKKGSLPKKMVLPFSYAIDDPRHYHVESAGAEGRICPEFLPP